MIYTNYAFNDGGYLFFNGQYCNLNLTMNSSYMYDMKSNLNQQSYLAQYMPTEKKGGGFLKILAFSLNVFMNETNIERIESTKQYGGVFMFQIKDTATIKI